MKILFTRFPLESARGGAENQTISLMKGLMKRGHAVSFVGSCPALLAMCKEHDIPHAKLEIGSPPVTKLDAVTFLWRKRAMRSKLKGMLDTFVEPDTVFMLSLTEKILLTPYAVQKKVNVIWQEHDTVGRWLRQNPSLPKLKEMSSNVTTVCVSELSARIFRDLGYAHVIGIPNGVSNAPHDFRHHEFDETLRLGCIARLSEEKGVDILAEAMRNTENTTLFLNGKGNVHVPSTPTVTVKADVADINDIYRQIDVLVLPSRNEDPFGLVVAEAMMRGIATICTDACGIAGYLTHELNTLIVPAGDQRALTEAIYRMHDTKLRERIAANGKKTAQEKFSMETMISNYEKVL